MKQKIGIIALDLDGTLLDSNKKLSEKNYAALQKAAEAGIEIVPTTGRFYGALPESIKNLPFLHYAITINGAQAVDVRSGEVIYSAELPWQQTVELMELFDTLPVIYDCYQENEAYMPAAQKALINEIAPDKHYIKMLHELRQPVEDLKSYLSEKKKGVQKVQFFTKDIALRDKLLNELPQKYDDLSVTCSLVNNLEINQIHANKGEALAALARYLNLPETATMSFGDGLNDISMLKSAGIGVAMANALQPCKDVADYVTLSNDEDGVAAAIEKFCFGE